MRLYISDDGNFIHMTAVFSGAGRRARNPICYAKIGAEASVAGHSLCIVDRVLVRAYLKDGLFAHMQEPPVVGIDPPSSPHKMVSSHYTEHGPRPINITWACIK